MKTDFEASRSQSAGDALLEFRKITKIFGTNRALSEVSLSVEPESFVVLLGPSGSGKTTMLRCAAGIEKTSEGSIYLDGELVDDGRRQVPPERRDLAMVFQDYALWPHMTACQNVAYALRRRKLARSEADRRAREMLNRVGLSALTERYPSEISGGEQQRVALARALVAGPRLLLFDEPLSNLDATLRDRMRVEIATLVREAKATALYITHDQNEAFALADKIGVMERGKLVQFGTPETIYRSPATPFVARLTGLSGELRGRIVVPSSDGVATVSLEDEAELAIRTAEPLMSGAAVRVLIRPSAVHLLPTTSSEIQLRSEVRDVAFGGRGYDHVVQLSSGTRLSGVFAEARWARGQRVGLKLDGIGCVVFPDDGSIV